MKHNQEQPLKPIQLSENNLLKVRNFWNCLLVLYLFLPHTIMAQFTCDTLGGSGGFRSSPTCAVENYGNFNTSVMHDKVIQITIHVLQPVWKICI